MRSRRWSTTIVVLTVAWLLVAEWQRREYVREVELLQGTLVQQGDTLIGVLIGAMGSHRRMGRFFQEQMQTTLEEMADSPDVLGVAVVSGDGTNVLAAGQVPKVSEFPSPGRFWDDSALRLVRHFELTPDTDRDVEIESRGRRGGQGRGAGRHWPDEGSVFSPGGQFAAVMGLDRTAVDAHCRDAVWTRTAVAISGGLVLIFLALAWRTNVRLVDERGRARMLEVETRHLRDLAQAAAGLAHETRNPLGLIRGWTQRLANSEFPLSEHQAGVQTVLEECDRVTARINQFLAFARPCEPQLQDVRLGDLFAELNMLLEPDLETKNLKYHFNDSCSNQTVQADRELLRQAAFNLIQNAIHFSPEGATVDVAVCPTSVAGFESSCPRHSGAQEALKSLPERSCRIEIADRGPGVEEDSVDSLFTPYFTTRPDGTGLGLAIVRRIALAHGWHVGYSPRKGGGSVFWLSGIHG